MGNFFENLFSGDNKRLSAFAKIADNVDGLNAEYARLSDDDLKAKTEQFKERVANGETLENIQVEAFATAREAAKRVIGEYPYKVQIMGASAMHGGDIAEMKTGEGKTLTSVLCVYLNALAQKGVHIVTVNEYLASRDAEWMGQIYEFLGLSVGTNVRQMSSSQKREAYASDITYTTNSELGFDYLRDNMVTKVEDRVLRPLYMAIVDEVDSILVDESRTPLIISGGAKQTANLYVNADKFVKSLGEGDYEIDVKTRAIMLSEAGVKHAEQYFKLENLYNVEHTQLVHHIQQALKANHIFARDVEYVVQDGEIVIVDSFTGRLMKGRAYSDGLHQAIEAKEGVEIKEETSTLATITYQNFFRLYEKLAGMTGTAKTEEEEFLSIYNMRVIEIPTNRPVVRVDHPDAIYGSVELKFTALVDEVEACYTRRQPILVGTVAVETSEVISELLDKRGIKHEVLNAKNHAREADIIAKAGHAGSVTIATNMAGRGTDIKLTDETRALGGLVVLGSERHESRRIDNQLRGRSGRQGDPGYSRFYVSLKDTLMVRFGGEKLEGIFKMFGDQAIESKRITNMIGSVQKRVEGYNFDIRKSLLDYDDVLRQQREIMYDQRNYVLENEDVHSIVKDMFDRAIQSVAKANTDAKGEVDIESFKQGLEVLGLEENTLHLDNLSGKSTHVVADSAMNQIWDTYEAKIADVKKQFLPFEKNIVLRNMDRNWIEHIDTMSKLRDGIHLRSYAQSNPLQAYVQEGYEMFEEMMERIAREVVFFLLKMKIERR